MKKPLAGLAACVLLSVGTLAQNFNPCIESTDIVCYLQPSIAFSQINSDPITTCVGGQVYICATYTNIAGEALITTTALDCSINTERGPINVSVSEVSWVATVGSFTASGAGLCATFAPTESGTGTIEFQLTYIDPCDNTPETITKTVQMTVNPATSFSIDSNPFNVTAEEGDNVTFTVGASGCPLIYQWKKNEVNLTDGGHISGATTAILTLSSVTVADVGVYTVEVSNPTGIQTSSSATLTVCHDNGLSYHDNVLGEKWVPIFESNSGEFYLGSVSYKFPDPKVIVGYKLEVVSCDPHWWWGYWSYYYAGALAFAPNRCEVMTSQTFDPAQKIADQALIWRRSLIDPDPWNQVFFWDWRGWYTSYLGLGVTNYIGTQKSSATAISSAAYTFSLFSNDYSGFGYPESYLFYGIGYARIQPIERVFGSSGTVCDGPPQLPPVEFNPPGSATMPSPITLSVPGHTSAAIYYTLDGSDPNRSSTLYAAPITITATSGLFIKAFATEAGTADAPISSAAFGIGCPAILRPPISQHLVPGKNAAFDVIATGSALEYQWYFNSTLLPGETGSSLLLFNVQPSQAGSYSVRVNNDCASLLSHSAILSMDASIAGQPVSQTVCHGAGASFSVTASGTPPLSYQWRHDGIDIPNATGSILNISTVSFDDAGDYSVSVSGYDNGTTSVDAHLTVGPTITDQPQSASVCVGDSATFSVGVADADSFGYQWKFNGTDIAGANSSSYTKTGATYADAGRYSVLVTSSCGPINSQPAVLSINAPPITSEPKNQSVLPGQTANFSVAAGGAFSGTYQWQFNEQNISGANSPSLSIPNVGQANVGNYRVILANACGQRTSRQARLAFDTAPTLSRIDPIELSARDGSFKVYLSQVLAASDAKDLEGDIIVFKIEAVLNGQLIINGLPFATENGSFPGNCLIDAQANVIWIPSGPVSKDGLDAFRVRAFDGVLLSTGGFGVKIVPAPKADLLGWGYSSFGSLGDGNVLGSQTIATKVRNLDEVTSVGAWSRRDSVTGAGITAAGHLWMWGDWSFGCFGEGFISGPVPNYDNLPMKWPLPLKVQMMGEHGLENFTDVSQVTIGSSDPDVQSVYAIKADGSLWSWGAISGEHSTAYSFPCLGRDVDQNDIMFDSGVAFTRKAQRVEGFVDSSGNPLRVIQTVKSDDMTLALCEDGTVWWWGEITASRIEGNQITFEIYSLDPTDPPNPESWPITPRKLPPFNSPVVQLAAGEFDHFMALCQDGTVWEFGYVPRLALNPLDPGNGHDVETCGRYCSVSTLPLRVDGFPNGVKVKSIAACGKYSLALLDNGNVYAWGRNLYWTWSSAVPVAVTLDDGMPLGAIVRIAAYGAGVLEPRIATAIDTHGQIWAWGDNYFGQLGFPRFGFLTDNVSMVPHRIFGIEKAKDVIPGGKSVFAIASLEEGKPTALTVIGRNQTNQLNWRPYEGASYYQIYCSLQPGGPYTPVGTSVNNTFIHSQFNGNPLINGTRYYYTVSAFVDGVESLQSAEASGIPIAPPDKPTGLAFGDIKFRSIELMWNSDLSLRSTGYKIYRAEDPAAEGILVGSIAATSQEYVDSTASAGPSYYYYIIAVNSGGDSVRSDRIGPETLDPNACAPAPVITQLLVEEEEIVAEDQTIISPKVTISWTVGPISDPVGFAIKWYDSTGSPETGHFRVRQVTDDPRLSLISTDANEVRTYSYEIGGASELVFSGSRRTWFKVAAVVEGEEGIESAMAGPILPCLDCNPDKPNDLRAIPGNQQVYLEWKEDLRAEYYKVRYKPAGGAWTEYFTVSENRFWHTNLVGGTTPLNNGTEYDYEVIAVRDELYDYFESDPAEVNATPLATISKSTKAFQIGADAYDSMVFVHWESLGTKPPYRCFVERKVANGNYAPISGTGIGFGFLDKDVVNGTTYTYRIAAMDANYHLFYSDTVEVTPNVQTSFKLLAEAGNNHVVLNWAPVSAQRYYIKHSLKAGGPYDILETVESGKSTFTHNNAQNGVDHYYMVSVLTPFNQVVDSNEKMVRPLATLKPVAPANFKVAEVNHRFVLSWNPSAGAVNYELSLLGNNIPIYSGSSTHFSYTPNPEPSEGAEFTFVLKAISSANLESGLVQQTVNYENPKLPTGIASVSLFIGKHKVTGEEVPTDLETIFTGPTNLLLRASLEMNSADANTSPESADNVSFQFYSGGELIGSADGHQSEITWFNVPNGVHEVMAIATARKGTGSANAYISETCSITVKVVPELATFQTASTDLQLSAPGLPIALSRSYDSRTENAGVLGKGWVASWDEPSIQIDSPLGSGWVEAGRDLTGTYHISESASHLITITLPGGATVYFVAQLTAKGSNPLTPEDDLTSLNFVSFETNQGTLRCSMDSASAGLSVLEADGVDADFDWDGEELLLVTDYNDDSTLFGPSEFIYTSPEGTEFTFSASDGKLERIKDRNGNVLTYGYVGSPRKLHSITHGNGRSVTFVETGTETDYTLSVKDTLGGAFPVIKYVIVGGFLKEIHKLTDRGVEWYEVTKFNYGSSGDDIDRLTEVFDPRGVRTLLNAYGENGDLEADGRLVSQTDAVGRVTTWSITGNELQVTRAVNSQSETVTVNHDDSGAITSVKDSAADPGKTFTYNDRGQLMAQTDASNKSSSITYDDKFRPVGGADELGNSTSMLLNDAGQPLATTNANGVVASFEYDDMGNPLVSTDAAKVVSEFAYYDPIMTDSKIAAAGLVWRNKRTAPSVPYPIVTEYTYYSSANAFHLKGELQSVTEKWENDGTAVAPIIPATFYEYDINGNRVAQTNTGTINGTAGQTIVTKYEYDAQNRLVKTIDPLERESTTIYNKIGKPEITKDALGRQTTNTYDAIGNLIETAYPDGSVTRTTYDEKNRAVFSQERAIPTSGVTTAPATMNVYDAEGRIKRVERRSGVALIKSIRTLIPAADEDIYEVIVSGGNSGTRVSYTRTLYDVNGRVKHSIDARGAVSEYGYDDAGRRVSVKVYKVYTNDLANVDGSITPTGDVMETTYGYDPNGNQIWVRDPVQQLLPDIEDNRTDFVYDDANRLKRTWFPKINGDTARNSRSTVYDGLGQRIRETDEAAVSTSFTYDFRGLLTSVTQNSGTPEAVTTLYRYDEQGNQIRQTDAKNHTTQFQYDELGRRTKRILPDNTSEEIVTYADVPETTGSSINVMKRSVTDFRGKTTVYLHDKLDRLLSKTPDVSLPTSEKTTVQFDYTISGQRARAVQSVGTSRTVRYAYDILGRLRVKDTPEGTLTYEYEDSGPVKKISAQYTYTGWAGNPPYTFESLTASSADTTRAEWNYRYDSLGRLAKVNPDTTDVTSPADATYTYNNVGALDTMKYRNDLESTYTYNERNWLRLIETKLGTTLKARFDYDGAATGASWDTARKLSPVGLRRGMDEVVNGVRRTVDYQYDPLRRLKKETITGSGPTGEVDYSSTDPLEGYDQVGNRRTRAVSTAALQNAGVTEVNGDLFDVKDRLNAGSGYTYDANGNTAADGAGIYQYDSENRLITFTNTLGTVFSFVYDADGNRIGKAFDDGNFARNTIYLVDDRNPTGYAQVMEEWESLEGGNFELKVAYAYGLDLVSQKRGTTVNYYGYDGLGSVRYLTDATGSVTDTDTYDAFGIEIASTGSTENSCRFAGEQWDVDLGMYYLRARYYKPETGRFVTMDSFEGTQRDPLSLHKYLYCRNDPCNRSDPSGLKDYFLAISYHGVNFIDWESYADTLSAFTYNFCDNSIVVDGVMPKDDIYVRSTTAIEAKKLAVGTDRITKILIIGHGGSTVGGAWANKPGSSDFSLAKLKNADSPHAKLLSYLKHYTDGHCEVELRACSVASSGKEFMLKMSSDLGANVIGYSDYYAICGWGDQYTAYSNGAWKMKKGRPYAGSWADPKAWRTSFYNIGDAIGNAGLNYSGY